MANSAINSVIEQFKKDKSKHLGDLKKLVAIPSVSFPNFDPKEVHRSGDAVKALLVESGLENVQMMTMGDSFPYVYGEWLKAPGKPTLLLYAHHDVQPPGNAEKWKSPAFEATERDGRLYGRGAADDKAGVVCHTAVIASYLKAAGKLPVNIKVLIEGEEEIGSGNLNAFVEKYKKTLQADAVVIMDAANFDVGMPSITIALRGVSIVEVEVKALEHSVHSGMWGGPIPDPAMALCKMLASAADADGRIAIPGVLDDVRALSEAEKEALAKLPFNEADFRKQSSLLSGVPFAGGDATAYEKMWFQPTISVNAFEASSRKQAGSIINASAWAKVSIRTVPNMDPEKTTRLLKEHLQKNCPWGLQVEIHSEGAGSWWFSKPEGEMIQAAQRALEFSFGTKPVLMGCGGSIPFVQSLCNAIGGKPALLLAVEDPYTNAHSENESLHLGDWEKAVIGEIQLLEEVAKLG